MHYYGKICLAVCLNAVLGMSGNKLNTRGETVYGKKQNTSDYKWKKYADELPETKRSFGNAQLD